MGATRTFDRLSLTLACAAAWTASLQAQRPPEPKIDLREAIEILAGEDFGAVFSVAYQVAYDTTLASTDVPAELQQSLVETLELYVTRFNEQLRRARLEDRAMSAYETGEDDARQVLTDAVGRLGDPANIPLLADALGNGSDNVLADFGELAVDEVLRVVNDPRSMRHQVISGLITLRFMVEDGTLGLTSLAKLREAARYHLDTPRDFAVLDWAMDLGFALGDEEFIELITLLAEGDTEALASRGITSEIGIESVQGHARIRLTGEPMGPERRSRNHLRLRH